MCVWENGEQLHIPLSWVYVCVCQQMLLYVYACFEKKKKENGWNLDNVVTADD